MSSSRVSLEELKKRIAIIHGDNLTFDESTYTTLRNKALFKDKDYGEWWISPDHVLAGKGHLIRGRKRQISSLEEVKSRLNLIHDSRILLKDETYVAISKKACFIDIKYGEFWSIVADVLNGQAGPKSRYERAQETFVKKYGVKHITQNKEVSLKQAKSLNYSTIKYHWKTGEELVCQASWEPKVIDYLNQLKINFKWQCEVFTTPILTNKGNETTYRPDLFLIDENKWIEIKGYFRDISRKKWEWFHSVYPNSELWDKKKLKELNIL